MIINFSTYKSKVSPDFEQCIGDCAICIEEMHMLASNSQILSCGHIFHEYCLNRIVPRRHTLPRCPICRSPFVSTNITHKIKLEQRSNERLLLSFAPRQSLIPIFFVMSQNVCDSM
mmetsp:Transcript_35099/g.41376  ORF Transcript_35099/g.41376 Transcript_35099/m.41376 type:complete len:116 (-) Transcript_35099:101-448(-)